MASYSGKRTGGVIYEGSRVSCSGIGNRRMIGPLGNCVGSEFSMGELVIYSKECLPT